MTKTTTKASAAAKQSASSAALIVPSGWRRICEEGRTASCGGSVGESSALLDPMALLEEAMRHFYWKAKIEESLWLAIRRWYSVHKEFEGAETAQRCAADYMSSSGHSRCDSASIFVIGNSRLRCDRFERKPSRDRLGLYEARKHHVRGRTEN